MPHAVSYPVTFKPAHRGAKPPLNDVDPVSGTPTGDGTMDFSIATGDDTGLLALLEDI